MIGRRTLTRLGFVGLVAFGGYFSYAAYESSRQLVHPDPSLDCRTPMTAYGWAFEAINYDPADDADQIGRAHV